VRWQATFFAEFTPRAREERSMLGLAQRLARIVGINWLLSSATTPL
jgi:hypothetical protein